MRKLFLLILLLAVVASAQKKVQVRTYTRKDGTVVQSHTRTAPGTATTAPKAAPAPKRSAPMATTVAPTTPSASLHRSSTGRIARSETAKRNLKSAHPCPSTGKTAGACPG